MERITQQSDDDCMLACIAMLTGRDLSVLREEYSAPPGLGLAQDLLREEYEFVKNFSLSANDDIYPLAYAVEDLVVHAESPIRERDLEKYEEIYRKDLEARLHEANASWGGDKWSSHHRHSLRFSANRAEVLHAFVVHEGRIYDPQTPPYWPSLGSLGGADKFENDYQVRSVTICTDDPVVTERLPRSPAGIEDRTSLPEYD